MNLTLRLADEVHEELRAEAFRTRTSVTEIIRKAIASRERPAFGCDVCGRPHVMVSTPGGIRFCEDHKPKVQS